MKYWVTILFNSVKYIPILYALIIAITSILSYYEISIKFIDIIKDFILPILLLIVSKAFKFCVYHTIFIYYIFMILCILLICSYIELQIDEYILLLTVIVTLILCIIIALISYIWKRSQRSLKNQKSQSN